MELIIAGTSAPLPQICAGKDNSGDEDEEDEDEEGEEEEEGGDDDGGMGGDEDEGTQLDRRRMSRAAGSHPLQSALR